MAEMITVIGYWDNRSGYPGVREPLVHVMAEERDLQSISMTADEARKMANALTRAAAFVMEPEEPEGGRFEEVVK